MRNVVVCCVACITNFLRRNRTNKTDWNHLKDCCAYLSSSCPVDERFGKIHHPLKKMSELDESLSSGLFSGKKDLYHGVTVNSQDEPCDAAQFTKKLEDSLKNWREKNVRGVWFKVALEHADWVPVLAKNEFVFHHAKKQYVMMYRWLPKKETCNIPVYAHHMIGVGAIVVNDSKEILVVKERFFLIPHWKLPGGYVEPGENLGDAAEREVLEETNVKAKFQYLVTLRHTHHVAFGCSDMYIIAALKPLSEEIKKNDEEIADCRWMKIEEYLEHPHIHEANKYFVQKYLEYQKSGVNIGCLQNVHPVLKRPQCVYSIMNNNSEQEREGNGD